MKWTVTLLTDTADSRALSFSPAVIGGDPDCDVCFPDSDLAPAQLQINRTALGLEVLNLASAKPMLANGKFCEKAIVRRLARCTSIQIGEARLLLTFGDRPDADLIRQHLSPAEQEVYWFYRVKDETYGPMPEEVFVEAADSGRFGPDDWVWRRVDSAPFRAHIVENLFIAPNRQASPASAVSRSETVCPHCGHVSRPE